MVLCLGELGTTDYHSVYILVSDSFAYRSPLKNSFARVKREKIQRENCVFFFDTEFGTKKNIRILTPRNQWNGHWMTYRNHRMKAGVPPCFLEMSCGEMFL